MKDTRKQKQNKKRSSRQIVAMLGVLLLVLLYIVTLIAAIVDSSQSAQWFRICLVATFALPLVIWLYSWMYSRLTGKSAIGDPNIPDPAGESSDNRTSHVPESSAHADISSTDIQE